MAETTPPSIERSKIGERPSIVTTKKEKDPRRVEAGKRLAAISKKAKERKKKERESAATPPSHGLVLALTTSGGLMLALTTVGVVAALATLWYTRKEYQLSTKESDRFTRGVDEVTKNGGEEGFLAQSFSPRASTRGEPRSLSDRESETRGRSREVSLSSVTEG